MPRRALAGLVGLVAAVLLGTGCQLRLDVRVAVERDGGGDVTVALGADADLAARAEAAGVDPLATFREAVGAAGGWDVAEEALPDGGRRVVASAGFDDPGGLRDLTAGLADGLAVPEVEAPLQPFDLVVGEGDVRVTGGAAAVPGAGVADLGAAPDQLVADLTAQDAVRYGVEVVLPAAALTHDATSAQVQPDGSTVLRWDVPLGAAVPIAATGVRPQAPVALYAAAAAVGAVVALLLVLGARAVLRRR